MTAHEALWTLKVQLQKTPQNMEAIQVLEGIVKSVNRIHIDDELNEIYGTEAQHLKNHMEKIGNQDLKTYKGEENG